MKNLKSSLFFGFVFSQIALTCSASWFSEISGVDIDMNRGTVSINAPKPQAIVPMIQNLPKDVSQALLNPAAPVAAAAIRRSRDEAINSGTQPIPAEIKAKLARFFPAYILDKTTWTVSGSRISIDTVLTKWLGQEGAITLDDVIVFSDARLTTKVELWAHELTNAVQYQTMGVDTFAFFYTLQWDSLESQARDNASRIVAALNDDPAKAPAYQLSVAPDAFNKQLTWDQLNSQAFKVIDPASCIWIKNGFTGNASPVTIVVSEVIMVDGYGRRFKMPISGPMCVFPPWSQGPLVSPPGMQIIGVTAAYQASGVVPQSYYPAITPIQ